MIDDILDRTEYDFESEVPPPLTPAEITKNKNFSDLKVELDFVHGHEKLYRQHVGSLLNIELHPEVERWASEIRFENVPDAPQLPIDFIRRILERLPVGLVKVSDLEAIDYELYPKIPIPNLDDSGFIDSAQPCKDFPLLEDFYLNVPEEGVPEENMQPGQYHRTRILIGYTSDGRIYPTQIPHTVSMNAQAIAYYQLHVLLHEFIHTVEQRFRLAKRTQDLKMKLPDGSETTFQDWRHRFLQSMTGLEPLFTSRYAESYGNRVKAGMNEDDVALAEQIAENFVAYYLGIVPNSHGFLNFADANFGNFNTAYPKLRGCESLRFELMKQFASAQYHEVK